MQHEQTNIHTEIQTYIYVQYIHHKLISQKNIKHYVIKFVSDLQQVGGFPRVLTFPPRMKGDSHITEIMLKVVLNTIPPITRIIHQMESQWFIFCVNMYIHWSNILLKLILNWFSWIFHLFKSELKSFKYFSNNFSNFHLQAFMI